MQGGATDRCERDRADPVIVAREERALYGRGDELAEATQGEHDAGAGAVTCASELCVCREGGMYPPNLFRPLRKGSDARKGKC
jgi:hypothetical protein